MRHFEEFEIEHLLNSTGGFFFRWRCRMHLKRCQLCRQRMEKVQADRNFAGRLKQAIRRMKENGLDDGCFR